MHHARVFPHGGVCRNRAEQSRAVREAWGAEGEDAAVLPKCAAVYPGGLLGVLSQWRSAGSHRQRRLASQARAGGRWGARRLACPQSAHGRPEQLASGASVSERRRDEKRARDRVPRWTICSTGDPPRRVGGGGGGAVLFYRVCACVRVWCFAAICCSTLRCFVPPGPLECSPLLLLYFALLCSALLCSAPLPCPSLPCPSEHSTPPSVFRNPDTTDSTRAISADEKHTCHCSPPPALF